MKAPKYVLSSLLALSLSALIGPATARYVQSDPIGQAGGNSTYGYVDQDPLRYSDPLGLCKVEVRCNLLSAGPILGKNLSHCYVVTTEPNGQSTYFRGGPSSSGGGLSAASTESHGGIGVGGDSGYGNIITESGRFLPGTIDWPTSRTPLTGSRMYVNNNKPCNCINDQLDRGLSEIQGANTPYNPLSTNSNSTAHQILRNLGINPGIAAAPAPGWGIPLPTAPTGSQGQCCEL